DELTDDIVYDIGAAFAQCLSPKTVVLGGDCRESTERLKAAIARGLTDMGVDVLDLGMCGTEEMYFATTHLDVDAGIEITASHNPIDYNGIKMVSRGSIPLDPENELDEVRKAAEARNFTKVAQKGTVSSVNIREAFAAKVCSFIDPAKLSPLKILVNSGNGAAGPAFDAIADKLAAMGSPVTFIRMDHEPDATFPNGIPNPLLKENQPRTAAAVREHGADFGVAWDGDFDRCFFFDHTGAFIDGYYIVGLLAQQALTAHKGATVIYDPRMIWNTQEIAADMGGQAIQTRVGHSFIKSAMRQHDAIYGGEMSAHHYFRDFMFCDSGMIPWLMVAELVSSTGTPLADLIAGRKAKFPTSGEQNFTINDPAAALKTLGVALESEAIAIEYADGLSMDFGDWRLNLRMSGTEPLVRLNIETRGDEAAVATHLERVKGILNL
ncbi:MAG: phosphomannomutase, partial [Alphaproteobacteria bacterium]